MKRNLWMVGAVSYWSVGLSGCGGSAAGWSIGDAAGTSSLSPAPTGSGAGNGGASAAGNGLALDLPPPAGEAGTFTGPMPMMLTDVIETEVGGYKLGEEVVPGGMAMPGTFKDNDGCGVIVGVVRDFNTVAPGGHPDFESFSGDSATQGLVARELDANHKPVYASHCEQTPDALLCPNGQQTTTQANFDQWYRDRTGVNRAYLLYFQLKPVGNILSFQSENFVPVDNVGFDDAYLGLDKKKHNYGFTTELHVKFKYSGGESFTFKGDDDMWAFINGRLAIDLGGLHPARTDTIVLDDHAAELGLEKGKVYPLELFHAERHSKGSHFRIDSTLSLVDCGTVSVVK